MNLDIPLIDKDIEQDMNRSQRWRGIMKCYPFTEERLAKWEPPYIVQPKLDGDRCVNKPMAATSILLSSEENQFLSVPHITQELMDSGMWPIPLDAELYSHELFKEGGHELIHSIASRKTNLHPRHKELELWVFDLKTADAQYDRLRQLMNLSSWPAHIKMTPFWVCRTLSEVKFVYDAVIKDGYEGIVVRHLHNKYAENKRSTWLMKFKPKRKDVYTVVGWKEEVSKDGFPKGRIGSLLLSSQPGDTFSVSAGLNDEQRAILWGTRHTLTGRKAIVYYQHLTNKGIPKGCFDVKVI